MPTRRQLIGAGATVAGALGLTVLPHRIRAAGRGGDVFATPGGDVVVHPVSHASFVLETSKGAIYCDPVGGAEAYAGLPPADLILVTHQHGDHYDATTLRALSRDDTPMIVNPAVHDITPEDLKPRATAIGNGETAEALGGGVEAIPAYNTTAGREKFHPKGRDNGYVLNLDGFRIYVSGDTEDVPEMRALEDIDLAFVCMNLPFTMDAEAAAAAVAAFRPRFVYPYHYRGRDGGTQDPAAFAERVGAAAEVKLGNWYG